MDLTFPKNVLEAEAKAVRGLINRLGDDFLKACELLLECRNGKGRAVVTGLGKTGLIGEKISATLASTGTPSISLHPVEALHGDLGRVEADDLVIILSNSGETEEIISLLGPIKEIGAKIIAITESKESTLGRAADVALATGIIAEACHLEMAPSCSTTALLALGDAIALTVSREAGFTRRDFERFHPGGSLGKKRRFFRVADVMRTGEAAPSLPVTASVAAVIAAISRAKAGACVLLDATRNIAGIFTDGDLRRCLDGIRDVGAVKVADVMSRAPRTIGPDRLAIDCVELMETPPRVTQLLVADERGVLVGALHLHDLFRARIV